MERETTNLIILVILALIIAIVWVGLTIYNKREEAEERGYLEYLGTLFKPGRFLLVYRCKSRVFEQWEPIYYLKILAYKSGRAWCEQYLPDGKRIDDGCEMNIRDLVELMDKSILTDGEPDGQHSCTVVKRWEREVQ